MISARNWPRTALALLPLLLVVAGCGVFTGDVPDVRMDSSADGRRIVFSSKGDLYLADLDSKKVTRLTETSQKETVPALSPDEKSVVYSSTAPDDSSADRIFKIDIGTKQVVQLTKEPDVSDYNPRYDRDGKKIYFVRGFRSQWRPTGTGWTDADLMVMNADGSGQERLTTGAYSIMADPTVLADGKTVLFQGAEWKNQKEGDEIGDSIDSVYSLDLSGNEKPKDFGAVELDSRLDELGAAETPTDKEADVQDKADGGDESDSSEPAAEAAGPRFVIVGNMVADLKTRKAAWIGHQFDIQLRSPRQIANNRILFVKQLGDDRFAYTFELWSADLDGKNAEKIVGNELFADPMKWKPGQ